MFPRSLDFDDGSTAKPEIVLGFLFLLMLACSEPCYPISPQVENSHTKKIA